MQTERERKKAEKELKRQAAEEKKRLKEIEFQKGLVEKFNAKQAKAQSGSTVSKLKAWLDEPPYKMTDRNLQVSLEYATNQYLQLECFYSVMSCLQALKADEWDQLYEGGADLLDFKEALALNKYFLAGMQMLSKKDAKTAGMISYPMMLKGQIKMNSHFGQGLVLKGAFEKG